MSYYDDDIEDKALSELAEERENEDGQQPTEEEMEQMWLEYQEEMVIEDET